MATKQVDRLGFDRIEIANVRRCYQANASNYAKLEKLYAKVRALGDDIKQLQDIIDSWEAPVQKLTESKLGKALSSKEVLLAHNEWDKFVELHPEYATSQPEATIEQTSETHEEEAEQVTGELSQEDPF